MQRTDGCSRDYLLLTPAAKSRITSIPGDTPCTALGVTGPGLDEGDGLGVGTGEAETGMRLAPVAKLKPAGLCETVVGSRK